MKMMKNRHLHLILQKKENKTKKTKIGMLNHTKGMGELQNQDSLVQNLLVTLNITGIIVSDTRSQVNVNRDQEYAHK